LGKGFVFTHRIVKPFSGDKTIPLSIVWALVLKEALMKIRLSFFKIYAAMLLALALGACDQSQEQTESLTDQLTAITIADLRNSPESVTYNGVPDDIVGVNHDGQLDDYSLEGDARIRENIRKHYEFLTLVDRAGLDEDEALYLDIALTVAERDMSRIDGPGYYTTNFLGYAVYPLTQLSGPHLDSQKLIQSQHPMATPQNARDYISRLGAYAKALGDSGLLVKRDEEMGYILPRFAVEKTIAGIEGFLSGAPEDNPLFVVFGNKLDQISGLNDEEKDALKAEALQVLSAEIYPAWENLKQVFISQLDKAPLDAGLWAQPDGDALYEKMVAANGDTDLTPAEIHQLGLDEVERITAEIDKILVAEGYTEGTPGERLAALALEDRFIYPNTDEGKADLINDLNAQLNDMKARLSDYFEVIPKADVIVKRIPVFSEETDPGGFYDNPSMDGTRPGIYWINLRNTAEVPSWQLPTLTYHESIPGHHFEVTQAVTATDRPLFRRLASFNAFSEGWALYAEYLAKEMGAYDGDPYGDLGRLQAELFRAVRLVVDTGMHYKRWSREQAIDYMARVTGNHIDSVTTEIERYAVWPGQALGYKLGMLKILELRRKAEAELGQAFDIKAFHNVVLGKGPMPMKIVEKRVNAWIEAQKQP